MQILHCVEMQFQCVLCIFRAVERLIFLIALIVRYFNRALTHQFDRTSLCRRLPSANDCTPCYSWLIYNMRPLSNLPSNI